MQIFLITFGVFLVVVVAMAIGYIFQKKTISGSCGGLGTIGIEKECDCPEPCDNRKKKMAKEEARRKMARVNLNGGTVHHTVIGKHGATTVLISPAPNGTGVIAGGPMRAVFEVMGVTDIVAKTIGSTNPYNVVRATIKGLLATSTPAEIAAKRGKTVQDILE